MPPKHIPKPIHQPFHLLPLQINLAGAALPQILLQLLQTLMDLPMLGEEVQLAPELGHLFCEDGEDVLLFDGVVEVELGAEVQPGLDELAGGEAASTGLSFFACAGAGAGVLQLGPG
jgi:hypothetical protein